MSTQNVWQLSLVIAVGFICIGILIGVLLIAYGKDGLFETREGLKAERADHETTREKMQKLLDQEFVLVRVSTEGAEKSDPDVSGHAQDRAFPFKGNCHDNGLNHRYGVMNSQGEVKRLCIYCGHPDGSAA